MPKRNSVTLLVVVVIAVALFVAGYFVGKALGESDARAAVTAGLSGPDPISSGKAS